MKQRKPSHTPGPWTMRERTNFGGGHFIEPGIATVHGAGRIPDANASLIAAAPDLLAICRNIESHLQRGAPVSEGKLLREKLKAAIAKAEGA